MKAYVVYETVATKEIEIPDKFAPLVEKGGEWSEEIEALWGEFDQYTGSDPHFWKQCNDLPGDVLAVEDENGNTMVEW